MRLAILLCASVALAGPATAQQTDPLAPLDPTTATEQPATTDSPATSAPGTQPALPPPPPRVIPKDWRGVFVAINQGDWEGARLGIWGLPDDPLKPYAKAELFAAKGSPKADLAQILAVLA